MREHKDRRSRQSAAAEPLEKIAGQADFYVPRTPNFLRMENCTGDPGLQDVDIANIPDRVLRQVSRVWAENLLIHAANRREKQGQ